MKTKFYSVTMLLFLVGSYYRTNAQANQQLSNLTAPTLVNAALLPNIDNARNLGSAAKSWKNIYLDGSVYLGGTRFLAYQTGTGTGNTAAGAAVLNSNTTGYSNTGVGSNALFSNNDGFENTATGYHALYTNTAGHANNAFGVSALAANTTGNYNAAVGNYTMANNTTGSANVALGVASMNANTTGSYNTASGIGAMNLNTIGNNNAAYGVNALNYNIRGNSNVAIGVRALFKNENISNLVAVGDSALFNLNSYQCTAVGSQAGMNNTTGSKNTYLGYHAGITVTAGTSNTIIGCNADVSSSTIINATAIGNAATVNASNKVRIGNSSVTSIGGQVGWTSFSDERIKNNVKENVPGLKFINLLRPVTYHYDIDKEQDILQRKDNDNSDGRYDITKIQFTGFLAQEVEAAAKNTGYDFSGVDAPKNENDLYGLRYAEFVVPLVKAVQELSKEVDDLKLQISELTKNQNLNLGQSTTDGTLKISAEQTTVSLLGQNIPNPFDKSTIIPFRIPKGCKDATLVVAQTGTGKIVRAIPVSCGETQLSLEAGALSAGTYMYTLYVDGRLIDAKQMVLAK